jgi:hypothetical protein
LPIYIARCINGGKRKPHAPARGTAAAASADLVRAGVKR